MAPRGQLATEIGNRFGVLLGQPGELGGPAANRPIMEGSNVRAPKETEFKRRPSKEVEGNFGKHTGPTGVGLSGEENGHQKPRKANGPPKAGLVGPFRGENKPCAILEDHVTGGSSSKTPQRRDGNEIGKRRYGNGKSDNPGSSWADRVRASSAKSRFSLDTGFVQEHGRTEYTLPDDLIDENFEDWTRCLVGFIPGSSFPFHAARTIALREWKQYGIESVNSYEGFFLFRFHNEERLQEVLADGPWLFGGKYMMLQQWHACFVFDKSKIDKVPVWIRLKGLPFTLWSHKALSFVASIVGKPLSCDRATFERSRLSFARVCVEVDASRPFVHNFSLKCKLSSNPIRVAVDYEWKPKRCPLCCVYGHNCKDIGKEDTQNNVELKQRITADQSMKGNLGLIDTLELVTKPVNNDVANRKGNMDSMGMEIPKETLGDEVVNTCGAVFQEEPSYNMKVVELQNTINSSVGHRPLESGEETSISNGQVIWPPTMNEAYDVDKGTLTLWEKQELESLGLIPIGLEDLSSTDDPSESINEDVVLSVAPLMVLGASEGNCQLNRNASLENGE